MDSGGKFLSNGQKMSLNIQEVTGINANFVQIAALEAQLAGSFPAPIVVAVDTAAQVKQTYLVDTTGGVVVITLPLAPADGSKVTIIDSEGNAGTNSISFVALAPDTITPNLLVSTNYGFSVALYNSGRWYCMTT